MPRCTLVSRLEGLCRPLGRSVLISGAVAAETTTPLVPLGEHVLRGYRGALHRLHPAGCVSEGVHRNRATFVTPTVRFTLPICLTPTKHHPTERTDDDTHDRDA
jgi:hypothetical protein